MTDGIIVAANQKVEHMIPWWWMNYSLNNTFPVTFANLGDLSPQIVQWCSERGKVIDAPTLNDLKLTPLSETNFPDEVKKKASDEVRLIWIKKPFIMLESSYDRTLWFDLDCWILDSIAPLFESCENEAGLGVVTEPEFYQNENLKNGLLSEGELMYNAGLIAYKKDSKMMQLWIEALLDENNKYYADQDALAKLLNKKILNFTTFCPLYNWFPLKRVHDDVKVLHCASVMKSMIEDQITLLKEKYHFHFPCP